MATMETNRKRWILFQAVMIPFVSWALYRIGRNLIHGGWGLLLGASAGAAYFVGRVIYLRRYESQRSL